MALLKTKRRAFLTAVASLPGLRTARSGRPGRRPRSPSRPVT